MKLWVLWAMALVATAAVARDADPDPCDKVAPYGLPKAKSAEANSVAVCEGYGNAPALYVSDYDRDEVAPHWVAYSLTRTQMLAVTDSKINRDTDAIPFQADPKIEDGDFQSPVNGDYNGIKAKGYDRGHLLNADSMEWSLDAYHSTFKVSNTALQASYFNEQLWQHVEDQERGWACDHKEIYAVTGVVFGGANAAFFQTKKGRKIFVPVYYWKVVYTPDDGGHAVGVIFPNVKMAGQLDADALKPVDTIEKMTGLDFIPGLSKADQARVEKEAPSADFWKITYPFRFKCR